MNLPVRGAGLQGVGLGLRRGLLQPLAHMNDSAVDFMELAPENWIGVGGRYGRQFQALSERFPLVCHGLSLSIGSPAPLDTEFLKDVKAFIDRFDVLAYTEHLSYCSDDKGHLYDLMPIPFTQEAVYYVAARIRQIQDILERRIGIEHVSYYAAPKVQAAEHLTEVDFVNAVLAEADCNLLLDVNNIYVNSINFDYDPLHFLDTIAGERTAYVHIAGHFEEAEDLRIDTHGCAIIDPVWQLLKEAYQRFGVLPTLLERDFNFPPLEELLAEVDKIRVIQNEIGGSASQNSSSALV